MQHSAESYPDTYAAFFAPRTHKFETVDFRVPHTPHNCRALFPRSDSERRTNARVTGILGLMVGVAVAIVAFIVDQLQRGLTIGLYTAAKRLYTSSSIWLGFFVFLLLSLAFVLVAAIMVVFVAPLGAGSGIPELKSYLNGVRVPGFLSFNSLVVKAIGIAFSISSGLICGKQGPMIHAGAIVGAGLSQMASARFRFRWRSHRLRFLRTEQWKRDFTAVGAAVGVAAAFGSPMGAWMWVYEEACSHWTWDIGLITLGGCLSAAIVARMLNFFASGVPGGFGVFTLTQFGKLVTPFNGAAFPLKDVPAFVLLGAVGGIAGAILPAVNKFITQFRYRHVTNRFPRICEALLIGLLTVIIRLLLPYVASDCRPVDPKYEAVLTPAPLSDFSRFTCTEGNFSPWAAVIYNPTDTIVRSLLYAPSTPAIPTTALVAALAYFFVFIVWTYGIAVPAGIFFPSFVLGSVYGRLVGQLVQAIFPDRTDVSLTGYAFLGAISALAGITRTISVAVIALEATGGNDASFASVLVAAVAKLVGDFLYARGIYDLHIDLKGIPFLAAKVPYLEKYDRLRVAEVMQKNVIGVRRLSRVSELLRMLRTNEHHAFPVFLKVGGNYNSDSTAAAAANSRKELGSTKQAEGGAETGQGARGPSLQDAETSSASMVGSRGGPQPSNLRYNRSTSILTPTNSGMEATIYDEGRKCVMWLDEVNTEVVHVPSDESNSSNKKNKNIASGGGGKSSSRRGAGSGDSSNEDNNNTDEPVQEEQQQQQQLGSQNQTPSRRIVEQRTEVLDYQLIGTIDRASLLVLLKHECDMKELSQHTGREVERTVPPDELDAAWPNAARLKGNEEEKLIKKVSDSGVMDNVIDLYNFIDPDPLLTSHCAPSVTAYRMFRRSGARHILVANMQSGRICGVMTRKDILLGSVQDALQRGLSLDEVKVDQSS